MNAQQSFPFGTDPEATGRAAARAGIPLAQAAAAEVARNAAGPSHRNAPETSRQAALANAPRSGTQRAKVLLVIYQEGWRWLHKGLTDDEIANAAGLVGNAVRPRRGELVAGGFVEDSGARRSSNMGHPAVVWSLTEEGTRVARELDR